MLPHLGVNVDHVATVRNARGTAYPDPIQAARIALDAGAYGITAHLREDRRHILDKDIQALRQLVPPGKKLNLEMALTSEMVDIAKTIRPDYVCLVPERRQERTTEGGLSISEIESKTRLIRQLKNSEIKISLFLSPDSKNVQKSIHMVQPHAVELHTGVYAEAFEESGATVEIKQLEECAKVILDAQIECHAGHGLNLDNLDPLCSLYVFQEYNIGHAIVAQSIFDSLSSVVKQYIAIMEKYPLE